jgi:gamma-glutamyltranspeptidase/glutathione hydrolase
MGNRRLPVAVAAANPVTAEVGAQTLRAGGGAVDAAVAMVLTSCVAETVFTGIAGGGFAIYHEAASATTTCVDFFVTVPGLGGHRGHSAEEIEIDFGGQVVPYAVGAPTVAVPGVPAGVAHLHRRWGRLSWADLVEPARAHAASGVAFAPLQSKVLGTVADAMLIGEGARVYRHGRGVLPAGAQLFHPGLDKTMKVLAEDGPSAFYTGAIAEQITDAVGEHGDLGAVDLAAYEVIETPPRRAMVGDIEVCARGDDLDDLLGTLARLELHPDPPRLARSLVAALRARAHRSETTSVAVTDADGNACAVTTSLGLSSGIWLADSGIHLNSMLGEKELVRGHTAAGSRMGSMMSPFIAFDAAGPVLVGGAAGGSRIRSALTQVIVNVLHRGMSVQDAISAPRLNPVPGRVHVEPGFSPDVLDALAPDEVVRWPHLDAYFGGVQCVGRSGPGADPRRGGEVRLLEEPADRE